MDKKEIIERLYALRAAISLLAMQFDKYDKANRDRVQQIYLDTATKFKNLMEENMYQSKGEYDHFFEFPGLTCRNVSRYGSEIRFFSATLSGRQYRRDYYQDDALCGKYWLSAIGSVCVYDKYALMSDSTRTKLLKYYPKLVRLVKDYEGENATFKFDRIDLDENRYEEWKRSYDKQPYEFRIVRDYLVDVAENAANKINYDCISFHKYNQSVSIEKYDEWTCASYLLNNVVCGRWLFTDEARTHFQTKLKELNEIIDAINKDTENFKPKGLTKLFGRNPNGWIIAQNEKSINLGNIAISNLQRGIAYLEDAIPKAKALIEEKEREMEEIKAEYVLMLRAIQEEFADVLDKRDWQDVDLLIYYFESGRADNLKEALLQVDNERRTNRIVDTIKEATNRICWTLKTGFDMLNRTLQQGFAAIESRIQQQNILLAQQNQLLAKQNGLIAQQNAQLSDLVSAANLSNALLAKQNESSEQLVSKMTTLERVIVG